LKLVLNHTINQSLNMKKYILILLIAALISCGEEKAEPIVLADPGTLKMKLDGVEMISPIANLPGAIYDPSSGTVNVIGYFKTQVNPADPSRISITLLDAKVGEFNIQGQGPAPEKNMAYYLDLDYDTYNSFSVQESIVGKCTLTQFDLNKKQISGTFEIKVANGSGSIIMEITNGSFTNLPID
jgi:hypothetical protein